jgi:hypothetical protein
MWVRYFIWDISYGVNKLKLVIDSYSHDEVIVLVFRYF